MAHLDLGVPSGILLRVTPPKVPRQFIARAHLEASHPLMDADAVIVQAPAGFGKTFLLAQWRREFLATGSVVAWVTAHAQDDDTRFLQCLAMSVRLAAARPTFGHTLITGV
ncbi:LuxR family transcriptional regulator, partial [bacterium]|nr:LuxR family transcriptional regulator [bacterium]